jgi:hypothetical protein
MRKEREGATAGDGAANRCSEEGEEGKGEGEE